MTYSKLELTDRVAVVLGGTSGIGRAIALGLAEARAHVIPVSRRAQLVDDAAREIESRERRSFRVTGDVDDRSSLETVCEKVLAEFGRLDILVNSAGWVKRTPTLEVMEADWNAILNTNLTGTLRACQIFGKQMIQRGYGRIVNIASIASFVGLFEVAAYCASKAAVANLTRNLGTEWCRFGVNVNAIAPGVFPTPLNAGLLEGTARGREYTMRIPMGRFGKVEELVGVAIFLASESASYITGQVIVVDGGLLASGVNS
ncbi:MAG TPA: SDR family oxidoreductase [Acidobacteriota bacterium]|jgi:NAD(P)-dependent dehydrogenase (short-subunit alcohol dehydrogenase family)|nr:SDR family oxidoreductase [Acidobacteriota bacterium]